MARLRPAPAPRGRLWTVLSVAPFAVVAALHLASKLTEATGLDLLTKPLLMPTLALAFLLLGRGLARQTQALMLGGLLFSWIGDITVESIVVGLSFFLLAHLCYIWLFLATFDRPYSWWSLIAVPWFAALVLALAPALGSFFAPVLVYGLVLGFMAAASTRANLVTALGGALFLASDSLLAFRLFTPALQSSGEDFLIMLLYIASQLLLVVGVLNRDAAGIPGNGRGASRLAREHAARG
ncbi:lysoplasmalogenase [Homoserinibacter sp. YIM 151385]|uniref:lysoplasmalogenase n=1 Tax=Homoserinibacter sp. YIM 151385 TaxID=2985506 RepID=UPI0022F00731|nr:lysoplasmalogenase [Homoserinibacter sp. YIM 151385]WBU38472.1 lysoplasmalogenase [Homoserinibacter sp. YIM 151385]